MRSTTTEQDVRLELRPPAVSYRAKIEIKDDSGAWQEWTDLDEQDLVRSVTWQDSIDQQMGSGEIVVSTKHYEDNLSPYAATNRWSGYLDVWREVRCHIAVVPNDAHYTVESGDWIELFHARVDHYAIGNDGASTTIPLRDALGAELMDTFIHTQEIQGGGSNDVEDVIQDLLDDWDPSSRTLTVDSSTDFGVTEYNQTKQPLLQAIRVLAQDTIGWDVRPLYRSGSWELVLYEPNRSPSSSDFDLDLEDIRDVRQFEATLEHVRNAIRVVYGNEAVETDRSDPARDVVIRTRETSPANDLSGTPVAGSSIDKYGLRFMELVEASSKLITAEVEAQNLADAAMSDLSQPVLTTVVHLGKIYWPAEVNDVVGLPADDIRTGSSQDLAVNRYVHTLSGSEMATTLTLQGNPKLSQGRWLEVEGRPGKMSGPVLRSPATPIPLTDAVPAGTRLSIPFPDRTGYNWDFVQVYRDTVPDFDEDSDNLIGVSRSNYLIDSGQDPGQTYYYRAKFVDRSLNESAASSAVSSTPQRIPPGYLDTLKTFAAGKDDDQPEGGTPARVEFDHYIIEEDADWYDFGSDEFTADEDGLYFVKYSVSAEIASSGATRVYSSLDLEHASGGIETPRYRQGDAQIVTDADVPFTSSFTGIVPLDAGDALVPRIYSSPNKGIEIKAEGTYLEVMKLPGTASRTGDDWGGARVFRTAGATGRIGPSQEDVKTEYDGTTLDGEVTVSGSGVQEWTAPQDGQYRIEALGAQGGTGGDSGSGGSGAKMSGTFTLEQGDTIYIVVGQQGLDASKTPSGGGGSFVSDDSLNPLLVAGGGGGYGVGDTTGLSIQASATTGEDGQDGGGGSSFGEGGTGGDGGDAADSRAAGGGGFSTNGEDTGTDSGGGSFVSGAIGGFGDGITDGGFGGGGAVDASTGWGACGGGGGYSGGGGGYADSDAAEAVGGGGGSYNSGVNQDNESGANTGDGRVIVDLIGGA